jgi:hypothetical protein
VLVGCQQGGRSVCLSVPSSVLLACPVLYRTPNPTAMSKKSSKQSEWQHSTVGHAADDGTPRRSERDCTAGWLVSDPPVPLCLSAATDHQAHARSMMDMMPSQRASVEHTQRHTWTTTVLVEPDAVDR